MVSVNTYLQKLPYYSYGFRGTCHRFLRSYPVSMLCTMESPQVSYLYQLVYLRGVYLGHYCIFVQQRCCSVSFDQLTSHKYHDIMVSNLGDLMSVNRYFRDHQLAYASTYFSLKRLYDVCSETVVLPYYFEPVLRYCIVSLLGRRVGGSQGI